MKAYKGFNKDMTCREFQYEEGHTYTTDKAELCECGFHACEDPLDAFRYYDPASSMYHEVELEDICVDVRDDTKICGKKITIGKTLSLDDILDAHRRYTADKGRYIHSEKLACTCSVGVNYTVFALRDGASINTWNGCFVKSQNDSSIVVGEGSVVYAGDRCAVNAGRFCVVNVGDESTVYCGGGSVVDCADRSIVDCDLNCKISGGKFSILRGYENCKFRGEMYSQFVCWNYNNEKCVETITIVDGVNIQPDVWYELKGGKFVEVKE